MKTEVGVLLESVHATRLESRIETVNLRPMSFDGHNILTPPPHNLSSWRFTRTLDISNIITFISNPSAETAPSASLSIVSFKVLLHRAAILVSRVS